MTTETCIIIIIIDVFVVVITSDKYQECPKVGHQKYFSNKRVKKYIFLDAFAILTYRF
jgi:hypothetical protein